MDLAKKTESDLATPEGMEDIFNLNDNLEGVIPRLPQIEIAHTVQLFKMPDDSKVEDFEGVIIDQQPANSYWVEKIGESGGNKPPTCFSLDGRVPSNKTDMPQAKNCADCPMNQFGTDGKGKACKNMKRLHILMEGSSLPKRLTVPPTSIKAADEYFTTLLDRGLPYRAVVTKFSLKRVSSGDFEYSELNYSMKNILSRDELLIVGNLVKQSKDSFRSQEISSDEYGAEKKEEDIPL